MLGRALFYLSEFGTLSPVPGNEAIEVVAEGTVWLKGVLIEETLNAASEADLVGVFLCPDRPTHLAMPATAEDHDRCPGQSGRQ